MASWVSIIVIVTAAAHTRFPLADGISGPNDECDHSNTNEQSHLGQRIGVTHSFLERRYS